MVHNLQCIARISFSRKKDFNILFPLKFIFSPEFSLVGLVARSLEEYVWKYVIKRIEQ